MKTKNNLEKINDFFSVWKDVFSNWKYLSLAVLVMAVFYVLNVVIASYDSILSAYRLLGFFGFAKLFSTFVLDFKERIFFSSFISLMVITVFLGLLTSLIFYRTNMIKKASGKTMGFFGATGIFLGILAPGCPACAMGILPVLGIGTAFLASLPLGGLELSILAILMLGFANFKITKSIKEGVVCRI